MTQEANDWLYFAVMEEEWDLIEYERQFNAGKKALAEFYLVVLEDIDEALGSPNADGNKLLQDLILMRKYKSEHDFAAIRPDVMAEYTQRYQSGESIESILG